MADLICASSLSQASELIEECDGDARLMLARVGVDPAVVGAYDRFIPFTSVSTLLGMCASELAVPDFALRLAARQDPDILGPLAIAARNAETIGDGLDQVTAFAHVYSPSISAELHIGETEVSYEFRTVIQRVPYRPHIVELALGVTLGTFRSLGGDDFRPLGLRRVSRLPAEKEAHRHRPGGKAGLPALRPRRRPDLGVHRMREDRDGRQPCRRPVALPELLSETGPAVCVLRAGQEDRHHDPGRAALLRLP